MGVHLTKYVPLRPKEAFYCTLSLTGRRQKNGVQVAATGCSINTMKHLSATVGSTSMFLCIYNLLFRSGSDNCAGLPNLFKGQTCSLQSKTPGPYNPHQIHPKTFNLSRTLPGGTDLVSVGRNLPGGEADQGPQKNIDIIHQGPAESPSIHPRRIQSFRPRLVANPA